MKVKLLRSFKRLILWEIACADMSLTGIDNLAYLINGELVGHVTPVNKGNPKVNSQDGLLVKLFATYIPFRFRDAKIEVFLKNLGTGEIIFSVYCRPHMGDIFLLSSNLSPPSPRQATLFQPEINRNTPNSQPKPKMLPMMSVTQLDDNIAFFTICSKNFLAHARALRRSLVPHYPNRKFYVVLCDNLDGYIDPAKEPFDFIFLEELDLPDLKEMAYRYNITEFNTSVKPFAFRVLLEKYAHSGVIYLDPDIMVVSPLLEVDELLKQSTPAILTPHLLQSAENDEMHDGKVLLFGIYNLGFLALSDQPIVRDFLGWWGRRLEKQCIIDLENGIFVDQKWADLLPSFVPDVQILHHSGYNVAYWNLPQRTIYRKNGEWLSNNSPLRFVHFSGNNLENSDIFSRHSQQVTIETIGELRYLLDHYREMVYAEGHHHYRHMPYAYSWEGENGVNLHAPSSLDKSGEKKNTQNEAPQLPLSSRHSKSKLRLLYMDWGVPRPDCDAGSVLTFNFLKLFVQFGFDVSFLPGSLNAEEPYATQLKAIGIHLISSVDASSVNGWLAQNANYFNVFFLSRGPVCGPYINLIKSKAPSAKIIFNTIDLHYLRELRQATLENDVNGITLAALTKKTEFELIEKSDATIVVSTEEVYEIWKEFPNAKLTVIPIPYDNIQGSISSFYDRKDIVFIGSFSHQPNTDAVLFFASEIFPYVQERLPEVQFLIVGGNPPSEIKELEKKPGIKVLGYVKDLSDVFNHVRLSVAPLRYGAGIKGKIGTSFCYGVPCIATPIAAEGMGLTDGVEILIGHTSDELITALVKAYSDEPLWNQLSLNGTKFVKTNYSSNVIGSKLWCLVRSLSQGWQQFEGFCEICNWDEWIQHSNKMKSGIFLERELLEQSLLPDNQDAGFVLEGYCCVCQKTTQFLSSYMYASGATLDGRVMPNWREHLQCEHCGLVNRVRAALHCLHSLAMPEPNARIYIMEQLTKTYEWLRRRYPNLIGSEFLGEQYQPGEIVQGVRNESVTCLSFKDRSFDHIISLDVLEHVPDYFAAFQELYRVLDDDGVLLFSVPFSLDSQKNIIRAILRSDGSIQHLFEPEYHGNPVDPDGGALCYQYFGWEMLDQLRSCGFTSVSALGFWSFNQGYLGREQYLFFARK